MKPCVRAAVFRDQSVDPGTRFETSYLIKDTANCDANLKTATVSNNENTRILIWINIDFFYFLGMLEYLRILIWINIFFLFKNA